MALEVQDNPFTSILMVEAADPEALASDADPAAGQRRLVVGADHLLYLLDDAGVKTLVGGASRASLGLATSDSPEFAALNIGHASDTTLARTAAGEIAVEGNRLFRVGGADVPVADGGTGASSASAARTNLGLVLGTDVASLTAGVVPIAQLATGTPTGSKFIRDDGTLQVPPGGGSLSTAQAILTSGDITLTQNTYTDIISVSLAAGTWLIIAQANLFSTSGAQDVSARLYDSTNAVSLSNGSMSMAATGYDETCPLCALVTLAGTATIKLQATGSGVGGAKALRATQTNSAGNVATQINAVQVA